MLFHGLLGQSIATFSTDFPHMEGSGIVLTTLFQDVPDGGQTVGADASVGPVINTTNIPQASVPLLIQQIGHHLLLAPLKVHLHLVELVVVLVGVHKDDGEGQGA